METLQEIGKEILERKNTHSSTMTDIEHTIDDVLDNIISVNKFLGGLNTTYLNIFGLLDRMGKLEVQSEEDAKALDSIIDELGLFAHRSSKLFANISKIDVFKSGCKTTLNDLRTNIRSIREYLEDIEERYLLSDEEDDFSQLMNSLI